MIGATSQRKGLTLCVHNRVIRRYFPRDIHILYQLIDRLLLSRYLRLQKCNLTAQLPIFLPEKIDHDSRLPQRLILQLNLIHQLLEGHLWRCNHNTRKFLPRIRVTFSMLGQTLWSSCRYESWRAVKNRRGRRWERGSLAGAGVGFYSRPLSQAPRGFIIWLYCLDSN